MGSPVQLIKNSIDWFRFPYVVKKAAVSDRLRQRVDPGIEASVDAAAAWLATAQDRSMSADGGMARDFSLIRGWATSYPETTGYIIPTMIAYAKWRDNPSYLERARRMLDWLLSIQMDDGAFQGGRIDSEPRVPVVFNTGQILIGLADGSREFGEPYTKSMERAAAWLIQVQDRDGCWRKGSSPFAMKGDKSYDTHVAWGLLEAHRAQPDEASLSAAIRNVDWTLGRQLENGWMSNCCLSNPEQPLTHTLGYCLRGILETYIETSEERFLEGATKLANGLCGVLKSDGFLPGRIKKDWSSGVSWACLTGTAQISYCWLKLYDITGIARFRDAGIVANRYVRETVSLQGSESTRGGVRGSFPIDGSYGRFEYLNWAAKFFVDANLLERELFGP